MAVGGRTYAGAPARRKARALDRSELKGKPLYKRFDWSWAWLLLVLLAALIFEHGLAEGLWRFSGFIYGLSFLQLVALLVLVLIGRKIQKHHIALPGSIVIFCSLFLVLIGKAEVVFKVSLFGVLLGSILGGGIAFTTSMTRERMSVAEREINAKLRRWIRKEK